ncbi:MAG: peroxidase [Planctomycetes bacterium]|nr:peroxidase [Planctomycetota bacterium]
MESVLRDYTSAPIHAREKALFAFLAKLNRESNKLSQQDVDTLKSAGWSDEELYDAVTVCALFNFYNKWIDATGVSDMQPEAYAASGERLAQHGYAPPQTTS